MKVLQKTKLSQSHYLLQIEAPEISKKCQPGQFVMICPDEKHRLAFLISSCNKKSISIVFSSKHKDGKHLMNLRKGAKLKTVIGPLGKPVPIEPYGNVCIVAESEGIGPALFLARAMKQLDNRVIMIAGFNDEKDVFYAEDIEDISNKYAIAVKKKGDSVDQLLNKFHNVIRRKHMHLVLSICDIPHMEQVAKLTELRTRNLSLLTPLIHDGVGMCGTCRILVDGEAKMACQEGPALDGAKVDWPSALNRYKAKGRTR